MVTTDHETIKEWAEQRGGHPAKVRASGKQGQGGVLRIDFPGYKGANTLEAISWDEFFKTFDDRELAFIYQDKTTEGKTSRFSKLVRRGDARG